MQILRQQIGITMKSKFRWAMALAVPLSLVAIGWPLYIFWDSQPTDPGQNASAIPPSQPNVSETVTALGRIEPKDKVITISGSSSLQFARVGQILVKEGEKVQLGQVIAILDNLNQLQAALKQAKQNVKLAQAQLAKVKAGEAKRGEIAAQEARIANLEAQFSGETATQKAKIARLKADLLRQTDAQNATITLLEAEWNNAKTECWRYETLFQEGAVNASARDTKCLRAKTAQEQIAEAKANRYQIVETLSEEINEAKAALNQILSTFPKRILEAKAILDQLKEVRPVDVQVAQAELEKAMAAVPKAEADLELTYVRAPVDGQILKIHTFAGESISSQGIVDLAQSQKMYVVAEVYETEIGKISLGQRATISSRALTRELKGTVEQIGLQIGKKDVFNSDPTLDIDARVIEIKIRLDSVDSQQAARLINLQVEVEINTSS